MKLTDENRLRASKSLEFLAGGVLYFQEQKNKLVSEHGSQSLTYKQAYYLEEAFRDAQRPLEALLTHINHYDK